MHEVWGGGRTGLFRANFKYIRMLLWGKGEGSERTENGSFLGNILFVWVLVSKRATQGAEG